MKPTPPRGPQWLKDAIFYQIYPQSFCDTNGDGIGDIPGVISKLDYIQSIGCNVVWLNPCFDSPFEDAGYDISNFNKIAPRYGTNADAKRLFREAHKRGMKVVLDLVAGHTSTRHRWFKESARPGVNEFTNRFIWTDIAWKGPGKTMESVRGYSDRNGQYVMNFFPFQPALNYGFANPDPKEPWQLPVSHPDSQATRRALWDILCYWLDLGADGFRVDMAFSLVKNDPDSKATIALWQGIRKDWQKKYPEAALLSEWSIPKRAIKAGFHVDFMIHFGTPAYTGLFRAEKERDSFQMTEKGGESIFDRKGKGDIKEFADIFREQFEATRNEGYISVPSGNHDISRISQGRTENELKVIYAFLLTLPGVPCIYYGDEIGMKYIADLPSKEGGFGRTGSRTPMQWTQGDKAGFSTASPSKFYLPLDPDANRPDVKTQEKDPDSLLNFIRTLCQLRQKNKALGALGNFEAVYAKKKTYPFAFRRSYGDESFLILLNPSGQNQKMILPDIKNAASLELIIGIGVELSSQKKGLVVDMGKSSFAILKSVSWK